MTKLVVTGAAGFIGHHLVEAVLRDTDWDVVILDRLTYAANGVRRLQEIGVFPDNPRVRLFLADVSKPLGICVEKEIGPVDYICHLAAGSSVDRSIACPRETIESNVMGTYEMLEYARRVKPTRFLYFSTDEVFGPARRGEQFDEWARYNSCNPYSAAKAGGEELALAWANTYDVPAIITHCMNVIGRRQHPEKFLPRVVRAALTGGTVNVHVDPINWLPCERNYLHADEVAQAILFLLNTVDPVREKYNIASSETISNLQLVYRVEEILDLDIHTNLINPQSIRPGADVRYGLSGTKMAEMGWAPKKSLLENLEETVRWMVKPENKSWLFLGDK